MATRTPKDGDSLAGPATDAGPPIAMDAEARQLIADGEAKTKAYLAEQPLKELPMLMRHVFGDVAFAQINSVAIKVQTGVAGIEVPAPFYDLLVNRQNHALEAEAKARRNSGL